MGILIGMGNINTGSFKAMINSMLGIPSGITKAQLRSTDMDTSSIVSVTDIGDNSVAIFLPDDTESEDDGETILVDSVGKRFEIKPLKDVVLNSPYQ
ncbi:hypothetical protein [Dyadobacter bucti]|uniref:hypothetical protein n=1 Tax=Dyadobacter bucti TaxID=2572203 RepID=UPI001107AAFC|nr:hypothetical protein [Dyadobacter bucti]